jgi:hypothetical protein
VKPAPRHIFRAPRPQRADPARVRDIWDTEPGDRRRFASMVRIIGPLGMRELDRLPAEVATLLLLLLFCRYRGWQRVDADGTIIDLAGELDGSHRIIPENLPEPLRRAWEAIQP